MCPILVTEGGSLAEPLGDVSTLEMVPRGCSLESYKKIKTVPTVSVTGDLTGER